MSSRSMSVAMERVNALRKLLEDGEISTQEELVEELRSQGFVVTQSTISRDLSRLNAMKTRDSNGRIVYRLPDDIPTAAPIPVTALKGLVTSVEHNGYLIVIHTSPGSASLLARQLDENRPEGILGTIAGEDTIFVAPASAKSISKTIDAILVEFQ